MIPYLFHVSILMAGGYVFYWLLLRQETFFRLNRIVLLACLFLPFVLPLVPIPTSWSLQLFPLASVSSFLPSSMVETNTEFLEKETILGEKEGVGDATEKITDPIVNKEITPQKTKTMLSFSQVMTYGYFTGVAVFTLAFFIQLIL